MRSRPVDVADGQLIAAVARGWGRHLDELEYVAVGGGSHHWRGGDLWITVDDLDAKPFLGATRAHAFEGLRTALEVAHLLRHTSGLEFVVPPERSRNGHVLVPIGQHYAVAVYPFLEGWSFRFGEPLPVAQRHALLEVLSRLHQATGSVAITAREAAVELGERATLERALAEVRQPWGGGPYSEAARQAMLAHQSDVEYLVEAFDKLANQVRQHARRMVITHGEPHPANVMQSTDGKLLLLDWDTVGLAPPERDLWWLEADAHAAGRAMDEAAMRLYRLRWQLDDLAYALSRLRAAHSDDIEAQLSSTTLARSVEVPVWMR